MMVTLVAHLPMRLWNCSRALPLSPLRTTEVLPAFTGGQDFFICAKGPAPLMGDSLTGAPHFFGNLILSGVVSNQLLRKEIPCTY